MSADWSCASWVRESLTGREVGMNIVIFLIVCVFLVVPLLLLNQNDGLNSVILSTGKAQHVIPPTDPGVRNPAETGSEVSTKEEARQRRHQLIMEVAEALRK